MLYFVGVGPGDPELITMKAVRVLQQADAIALPDSGRGDSVVWKIAGEWIQEKPVCSISIPMLGDKLDWQHAHDRAVEVLLERLEEYETIVYPVLGDPGIYASSSYLLRRIAPLHPCKVIPGVPAMCAAAAELGVPLCEQRETLTVIDHLKDGVSIPKGNVVVMKVGKSLDALQKAAGGRSIYLASDVGFKNQRIGTLDVEQGDYSYFTTAIVKSE